MAGFLTPLRLEYIDGRFWATTEKFEYHLGAPDGIERVVIPAGFMTDFASIPRALWPVLPPTGPYGKAAVVHDWLYQVREVRRMPTIDVIDDQGKPAGRIVMPTGARLVNRAEADAVFNEAMEVLTVRRTQRWTLYSGVRVGGWVTWNRYRRSDR